MVQRPGSAKGFMFMSLEDETGIGNVIITPQFYQQNVEKIIRSRYVRVSGVVQNQSGVVHIKARAIEPVNMNAPQISPRHNYAV